MQYEYLKIKCGFYCSCLLRTLTCTKVVIVVGIAWSFCQLIIGATVFSGVLTANADSSSPDAPLTTTLPYFDDAEFGASTKHKWKPWTGWGINSSAWLALSIMSFVFYMAGVMSVLFGMIKQRPQFLLPYFVIGAAEWIQKLVFVILMGMSFWDTGSNAPNAVMVVFVIFVAFLAYHILMFKIIYYCYRYLKLITSEQQGQEVPETPYARFER